MHIRLVVLGLGFRANIGVLVQGLGLGFRVGKVGMRLLKDGCNCTMRVNLGSLHGLGCRV